MSETRELVFIRHAETDLVNTFCGHSDPPVNVHGQEQILELMGHLASRSFDAVYTSDLHRAVQTAAPLAAAFGVPYTTTRSLREINFGDWEGLTWKQIEALDPGYAQRWLDSFPNLPAPHGERFTSFEHRVLTEVERLLRLTTGQRLAIVTHAGVMRVVLQNLMGHTHQQAWELTRPYCSFLVYTGLSATSEASQ